jgi:hypothetical protein
MESIQEDKSRCLLVCAPTNKAVSVLCTRFLDAIKGDQFPCNVVLVGDDDKLLDDDYSRKGSGGESSKLRSIFLYTWINTVLDDYSRIRNYLKSRDRRDGRGMISLSHRLERRLQHSLSGLSKDMLKAMSKVSKWLELDTSTHGKGSPTETLAIVNGIMKTIQEWRKDLIWQDLLGSAHVIFCTLASAGASILKKSVVGVSDLIVDEAAASTEPEMYIPFHYKPLRLLVMGDPKQLPATVVSRLAEERGMSKSLHERLMYDCNYKHIMVSLCVCCSLLHVNQQKKLTGVSMSPFAAGCTVSHEARS